MSDISTRRNERQLLKRHLHTFLKNRLRILRNPALGCARSSEMGFGIAYFSGSGELPLGALVSLWSEGEMLARCTHPGCPGTVFLFFLGGSPLTGANIWWGVCESCGSIVEGSFPHAQSRSFNERAGRIIRARTEWGYNPNLSDPIRAEGGMFIGRSHIELQVNLDEATKLRAIGSSGRPIREVINELRRGFDYETFLLEYIAPNRSTQTPECLDRAVNLLFLNRVHPKHLAMILELWDTAGPPPVPAYRKASLLLDLDFKRKALRSYSVLRLPGFG